MAVIALIEDKPEHSGPMTAALEMAGHKVHLYETEASALAAVNDRHFDVILLDVELGTSEEAGHNILDHIERKERSRVLVISMSPDFEKLRPRMLRMGAWDYIVKPLEPETLLMKVDRLMADVGARSGAAPQTHGNVSWDPNRSSDMRWGTQDLVIPAMACDLVKMLVLADGSTLTYQHLMKELSISKESLRQHVKNAREAFKAIDDGFDALRNEPLRGYFWKEN